MTNLVCSVGIPMYYTEKHGYSAPFSVCSSDTTLTYSYQRDFSTNNELIPIPSQNYDIEDYHSIFSPWDYLIFNPYHVKTGEDEIIEQFAVLKQFSIKLLESTKDIDPEIAKAVHEKFWDLL